MSVSTGPTGVTPTVPDPQLAVKYQRSWDGATEAQREGNAFGLGFNTLKKKIKTC